MKLTTQKTFFSGITILVIDEGFSFDDFELIVAQESTRENGVSLYTVVNYITGDIDNALAKKIFADGSWGGYTHRDTEQRITVNVNAEFSMKGVRKEKRAETLLRKQEAALVVARDGWEEAKRVALADINERLVTFVEQHNAETVRVTLNNFEGTHLVKIVQDTPEVISAVTALNELEKQLDAIREKRDVANEELQTSLNVAMLNKLNGDNWKVSGGEVIAAPVADAIKEMLTDGKAFNVSNNRFGF